MVSTKSKKTKKPTKKKKNVSKNKSKNNKNIKVKEEKKFDMPGQRYEKPQDLDVLRLFYESAYNENPKSEMATKWCLAHGLLPYDVAESLVKKETTKKETKPLKSKTKKIQRT